MLGAGQYHQGQCEYTTKITQPKERPNHVILQLASVAPQSAQSQLVQPHNAPKRIIIALESNVHFTRYDTVTIQGVPCQVGRYRSKADFRNVI